MPSTTAASPAFAVGTYISESPAFFAAIVMERTPLTGLMSPERLTSPTKHLPSVFALISTLHLSMDKRIEISKPVPCFILSAGARFIVILVLGNSMPLDLIAALILENASFTAASGSPTRLNAGIVPAE